MKYLRWGLWIFVVTNGLCTLAAAEKFGTLGRDTLVSETASFSAPTMTIEKPKTAASPATGPSDMSKEIFEPSSLPNVYSVSPPKITVPTFEMPAMLTAPQGQALTMKKRTLLQTIGDELRKYWLLIVLGFVVLLVIYAMHKTPSGAPPPPQAATDQEPGKKDIWEKF